jgi:hypothetical protein
MAFGKTAGTFVLVAAALGAADMQFPVRHEHVRKGCYGTMLVTAEGITFKGPKKHAWTWRYRDIEQLKLSPGRLDVLTYEDRRLRLGADHVYTFTGSIPTTVYAFWKDRLDQRFVAAVAEPARGWRLPVKHLRRIRGSQGYLEFGPDRIVYTTDTKGEARTWRYQDIEGISSSGPFQLTITSFERARLHYGDRKGFNFQLKEPLSEARYDQLWLQIQKKNGSIQ